MILLPKHNNRICQQNLAKPGAIVATDVCFKEIHVVVFYYYIRGVFPKSVVEGGYSSNLTIRVGLVQIFELGRKNCFYRRNGILVEVSPAVLRAI